MNIVGMMWCKNEADILPYTLYKALCHVDSLFIADDGSDDRSWDIIQSFKAARPDKIEHFQCEPDQQDKGQRQALLDRIRERYKPEDTWVQVIESDVVILETDVRAAIRDHAEQDLAVSWQMLNACRFPGTWKQVDTWPHWPLPIDYIMPMAHRMECLLYTFRPLPELIFSGPWRPYPRGFGAHATGPVKVDHRTEDAPLLLHVGHRGPRHFHNKYKNMGERHRRYHNWILTSPEMVESTVDFFNGTWNNKDKIFVSTRGGWVDYRRGRHAAQD